MYKRQVLGPLIFKSFTPDNHLIFSLDNDDLSISRLREDDIIILYPYDENKNSPLSQQLLKGYIIDINESKEMCIRDRS